MSYNGWRNRATWNAHLHFANTEHLYLRVTEICAKPKLLTAAADDLHDFAYNLWGIATPDGDRLVAVYWRDVARAFREE